MSSNPNDDPTTQKYQPTDSYWGNTEFRRPSGNPWQDATFHRQVITKTLIDVPRQGPADQACVLGAGPCNDIDLKQLVNRFDRVVLVDSNAENVAAATRFQNCEHDDTISIVKADLSGVDSCPQNANLEQRLAAIENHRVESLATYDIVASTCLLSQLIRGALADLQPEDKGFSQFVAAIRQRHIQLMLNHIKPGGRGFLVSDIVSSESLPELHTVKDAQLTPLLQKAVAQNNHFHGVNPGRIIQTLQDEPAISSQIDKFRVTEPWIWIESQRLYACLGFKFQKKR